MFGRARLTGSASARSCPRLIAKFCPRLIAKIASWCVSAHGDPAPVQQAGTAITW
jgi:hypothetical protein